MNATLTLRRPDDWHLHLRDGAALAATLPHTAARFARAIVMPNLTPPVTDTAQASAYRQRILDALPRGASFEPLMTLYLTDNTPPSEIAKAKASRLVYGCKLYPAGATTNSASGVTDLRHIAAVLAEMATQDMVLQVHGEITGDGVDVFDREARFIDELLAPLAQQYPRLRIVFEHITSKAAVEFVRSARAGVAATITPQHLLYTRNEIFRGGIRPHYYCLPILKTEADRAALLAAATSGEPRFFLGSDSAPHSRGDKENACGCAGMYSAHAGIELYAEAFDQAGALQALEGFAANFGADFYRLPRNAGQITLIKDAWEVPPSYRFGTGELVPMRAGERLAWRLATSSASGVS